MAAARSLWRATGLSGEDFEKPIIAIVNSYTQFVPGHVHLKPLGDIVAKEVWKAGGVPREMNTIAVDDGIAMGHAGMLYSLPSRELIADSIEYMINAHCVDAMVCISNCDKITPGMQLAAMRLNIPTIFVSGGPMEAGRAGDGPEARNFDVIETMVASADRSIDDAELEEMEKSACPTCGSCAGMFTANSMNCLGEALGLALPGNGTLLATHTFRRNLFEDAGRLIVELSKRWYEQDDPTALPRGIATFAAFENAMSVDIAMGGSTNTVLHLLGMAAEGDVDFKMADIDRLSRRVPHLCKVAPSTNQFHIQDVHRAGGVAAILGELDRLNLLDTSVPTVHSRSIRDFIDDWDITRTKSADVSAFYRAGPGGVRSAVAFSQSAAYADLDTDRREGCIRDVKGAYSADGGLAVLFGNLAAQGAIVKTAGVPKDLLSFRGPARVFESQEAVTAAILAGVIEAGTAIIVRYEGPKGGPGMQEMLHPSSFLKSMGLASSCALITDGRFSGGSSGLSIGHVSPEAAECGTIGVVEDGDMVVVDIENRSLSVEIPENEISKRRRVMTNLFGARWRPVSRDRKVSTALQLYGLSVSSAAHGAVRTLQPLIGED